MVRFAEHVMADGPTASTYHRLLCSRGAVDRKRRGGECWGLTRLERRPANFLNTSSAHFQQGRVKDRKVGKDVVPPGTYNG